LGQDHDSTLRPQHAATALAAPGVRRENSRGSVSILVTRARVPHLETPAHQRAAIPRSPGRSTPLRYLDGSAGVHVHPVIRQPWSPFFIAKVQMPFSLCGASFTFMVKVAATTA